jgi:para-aminobenzoate synthetase component I
MREDMMFRLLAKDPKIGGVNIQKLEDKKPFLDISAEFAHILGTVLLMSGGDLDSSRYHILGIKPWLTFMGRGRRMKITLFKKDYEFEADPFDTLKLIVKAYPIGTQSISLPFVSGLMGYLSYDLKDNLEHLPRTSIDDLLLPSICLFAPSMVYIHDKKLNSTWLCTPIWTSSEPGDSIFSANQFAANHGSSMPLRNESINRVQGFRPNLIKQEYVRALEKIKKYITSGDVYQVNFSQRFETDCYGDSFELFKKYYLDNPAPFFAYINAGNHYIISTSPERFINRNGYNIETRPIKGTRPRGKNKFDDQVNRKELEESVKDDAELSMIVDLMRNDLGKICEAGSVFVRQHKKVEAYKNVFHMVSKIEGKLASNYDSVDIIKATFPAGSITGCPKIRAMEIIDELEPNRRHVYTGSIGYISFHDTMDLSVAIRTGTIYNGKMFFSVGGGIVYDSKPSEEYLETLYKGQTFIKQKGKTLRDTHKEQAWVNGMIKPLDQAHIKISDLGFQFGYGFFETIRYSKGVPCYLKEHIARFERAWKKLFQKDIPDLSWHEIINQVVTSNGLNDGILSIKIIATWGSRTEPPYDHGIIVTAKPLIYGSSNKNILGLKLATYPYPRQTPLACHKTLNYAYYYLANKWAKEQGADDALIMNPDRSISETTKANIILIKGEKVIRPLSLYALPGIMERKALDLFIQWGYSQENRNLDIEDLLAADDVFVTNSLLGAAQIINIDNKDRGSSKDICKKLNDVILL